MEITIKVGDREYVVEQETLLDTDHGTSPFAFKFDENSTVWDRDREINTYYLRIQENYLNDKLKFRGYLFLNDVYSDLGMPRTKIGQLVGWVFNPNNRVNLGIDHDRNKNDKNVFILDPNVDGFILDKI